jgi:hypothetical protein
MQVLGLENVGEKPIGLYALRQSELNNMDLQVEYEQKRANVTVPEGSSLLISFQ